jgi:hypothetical protein
VIEIPDGCLLALSETASGMVNGVRHQVLSFGSGFAVVHDNFVQNFEVAVNAIEQGVSDRAPNALAP